MLTYGTLGCGKRLRVPRYISLLSLANFQDGCLSFLIHAYCRKIIKYKKKKSSEKKNKNGHCLLFSQEWLCDLWLALVSLGWPD